MSDFEIIKFKKMLDQISQFIGHGTSMLTILIPPNENLQVVKSLLEENLSSASNIKSKENYNNVKSICVSAIEKLKTLNKNFKNGLVLLVGIDINNNKINISFEPIKPILSRIYYFGNIFLCDSLYEMIKPQNLYGYIFISGSCFICGIQENGIVKILHKKNVRLLKKHNKGGQSSVRFARLRDENRLNYINYCISISKDIFLKIKNYSNNILNDVILGGIANIEDEFYENLTNDLKKIINPNKIKLQLDENKGFDELIKLSIPLLNDSIIRNEIKIINNFFDLLYNNDNLIIFTIEDIINNIINNSLSEIIIFNDIKLFINEKTLDFCFDNKKDYIDIFEFLSLNNNKKLKINIVSNKTPEGNQFVKTFNGIVGILNF
jgi:peptide chain release factor subunit 1